MMVTSEVSERWLRELEILMRLDHPNIVKSLPLPEGLEFMQSVSSTPYICMEYCDGGDLRQVRTMNDCAYLLFVEVNGGAVLCLLSHTPSLGLLRQY